MALIPPRGSFPACADLPVIISSNSPTPFRPVLRLPPGIGGARTSAAVERRTSAPTPARVYLAPGLVVTGNQKSYRPHGLVASLFECAQGKKGDHQARFHIKCPGTVSEPVLYAKRLPLKRSYRPDSV